MPAVAKGQTMYIYLMILFGVLLNAGAQLMLKAGTLKIGQFAFTTANILPITLKLLTNWPIMTGLCMYVISVGVWILVLSRVQVSLAYPMLSIGYIVNALAAYYFFAEPLTAMRIAGIFIIMIGVYFVAQTG